MCGCGREKVKIGEDTTEQLDYEPGKLLVRLRHIYPKYACSCCKDGVTAAPRVASPADRRRAGRTRFTFLCHGQQIRCAHSALSPKSRMSWARAGVFLGAKLTLCDWIRQCAIVFQAAFWST